MLYAKHKQFHRDSRPFHLYQRVPQEPLVPSALFESRDSRVPAARPPIPSLLSLPNRPPRLHPPHRQAEHHLRPGGRPQMLLGPGPVMQPPVVMHQMPVARGKRYPPPFLPRGLGQSLLGPPPVRAPLRNTPVGSMSGCNPRPHRPCMEGCMRVSQRKRDSGHVATGKNNNHMTKSKTDAKPTKTENKQDVCDEGSSPDQTEPTVKKRRNLGAGEQTVEAQSAEAEQTVADTESGVSAEPAAGEEESPPVETEEDVGQGRTADVQGVGTSLKVTIQRSSESRAFSTGPEDSTTATVPTGQDPDQDKSTASGKFCCYICNVTCPDQQEFQNHMISLAHQQKMMEIQHLSNTCLATLLPQMQHSLQGSHREKRQGLQRWCAICQSHFTGDLIEHRRSKKHKVAKVSSRPFCTVCERYFRTPRKFVEHMKSPEHKQQVEELREEGGPDVMEELITVDAIGCFEGEDDYEEEGNEDEDEDANPEKAISEMMGDCEGYDPDTQYGAGFVVPAAGFLCKLCHKFYHFESSARETHCKSLMHYQNLQKYKAMLPLPREGEESSGSSKSPTPNPAVSGECPAKAEHEQDGKPQSPEDHLTSRDASPTSVPSPEDAATRQPAVAAQDLARTASGDQELTARKKKAFRRSSRT